MQPAEASQGPKAGSARQPGPVSSQAAIASMRQHGIAFTADNYAVWHCHLSGANPALTRALDIVLSNGMAIEDRTLRVLYSRHFCQARETLALQGITQRALVTLAELRQATLNQAGPDRAGPGHTTDALIQRLTQDLQDAAVQSEQITRMLTQSEERIEQLERFLDEARQDAATDGLTGLANRRAFEAALRAIAGDAMNDGSDVAFLLVDIDHFKQVNDRWGHAAGDAVLRMLADTLSRAVRGRDVVARYGGEEFAIILPGTNQRGALATAENLRLAVEAQWLPIPEADGQINVTISAGASCYDHGERLAAWLSRADTALYAAKQTGRNRTRFGALLGQADNVVALPLHG